VALHYEHRLSRAGPFSAQVSDAQIARGREPPVELQFSLTRPLTLLRGAEIQKVSTNRLLDLVSQITDEHDEPGVRLVYLAVRLDCLLVGGHGVPHRHIVLADALLAKRSEGPHGRVVRRVVKGPMTLASGARTGKGRRYDDNGSGY
jgi:hypothetical protein